MTTTGSITNSTALAIGDVFVVNVLDQDKNFIKNFGKANQIIVSVLEARDISVELDGDSRRRYDFTGGGTFVLTKDEDQQSFYMVKITNIDDDDTISSQKIRATFQKVV